MGGWGRNNGISLKYLPIALGQKRKSSEQPQSLNTLRKLKDELNDIQKTLQELIFY